MVPENVTPLYISELYRQHTSAQADRLVHPYVGQWMRVSAKVKDVWEMDRIISIPAKMEDDATVVMDFDKKWSDRLLGLRRDTTIIAYGQFSRVMSTGTVSLNNCELSAS
jgi:hypothetical protein